MPNCPDGGLFNNPTATAANICFFAMGIILAVLFTSTAVLILRAVSNASLSREELEKIVCQDRALGNLISEHFILKHHRLDEDPMLSDKMRTDEASEDAE